MMASGDHRESPGHEELVELLSAYQLGALSVEERQAFESHVLACDACFAELERGTVVAAALRANAPRFRRILEEEPAVVTARRPGGDGSKAPPGSWLRPRVVAPALVAVAALLLLLARVPDQDYRELATFPREAMPSVAVRGAGGDDAALELLESGAGYFDLGRYEEAERRFAAALERDPQLAEAAYFLGLSRVFRGDVEGALPPLERAAEIGAEDQPKYAWVLANAYLRAARVAEARRALEELATGEGRYAEQARDLQQRLPD